MNTADTNQTATRSARRIEDDPEQWEVIDHAGNRVGIIWRCTNGWRSAAINGPAQRGISADTYDQVYEHAIANF